VLWLVYVSVLLLLLIRLRVFSGALRLMLVLICCTGGWCIMEKTWTASSLPITATFCTFLVYALTCSHCISSCVVRCYCEQMEWRLVIATLQSLMWVLFVILAWFCWCFFIKAFELASFNKLLLRLNELRHWLSVLRWVASTINTVFRANVFVAKRWEKLAVSCKLYCKGSWSTRISLFKIRITVCALKWLFML